MTEEVMEQDELLLTPEEEKCVENKLRDSYLKSLKAYESSKGYSQKPKLPTLEEMVKAKLEAQLAKAKRHYHPSIEAQKLQVELAKKQERERIANNLDGLYWNLPEGTLRDKLLEFVLYLKGDKNSKWQALQGLEEG